ncbi:MAG: hypothetical protein Q7S51_07300, partial [Gallionellaceae bacterium]|nr:hypothetical protein [Gallionellaceae bacterium]
MKRLAAILAITVLLLSMAGVWLVMSTAGARWIMESVSRPGGLEIVASKMEGRLFDHLLLSNLHITWAHTEIAIERLELEWQPLKLWTGNAAFKSIKLQGLKIQDNSTQPLSLLPWPKASGIAALLHG